MGSILQSQRMDKTFFRWISKESKMTFAMSDMNGHGLKIIIDEVQKSYHFHILKTYL